jgi:hypothetical protein
MKTIIIMEDAFVWAVHMAASSSNQYTLIVEPQG